MIVCGAQHSLWVDDNGIVYTLGNSQLLSKRTDGLYRVPMNVPIVKIACGFYHNLLLGVSGVVWGFGRNNRNCLGKGTAKWKPEILIENLASNIFCGPNTSFFIDNHGNTSAMGELKFCNLSVKQSESPLCIPNLSNIKDIECTESFALYLDVYDHLYTSNSNSLPKLYTKSESHDAEEVSKISSGCTQGYALLNSGVLVEFFCENEELIMSTIPFSGTIKNISSGFYHHMLVDSDDNLLSWGVNSFEQCGFTTNREYVQNPTKTLVQGVRVISKGGLHTIIKTDTDVLAFGNNKFSQMGSNLEVYSQEGIYKLPVEYYDTISNSLRFTNQKSARN